MQKAKELTKENPYLVTRVSLVDSIKSIPMGASAIYDCRVAGPMSSAKSCVCRLNKTAKYEAYSITTKDNGVTYTVTCNKK